MSANPHFWIWTGLLGFSLACWGYAIWKGDRRKWHLYLPVSSLPLFWGTVELVETISKDGFQWWTFIPFATAALIGLFFGIRIVQKQRWAQFERKLNSHPD